jgi:hypothetical protein
VLLIANVAWLPDFAYQGASHVYYVEGSFTLAGNIA